MRRKDGDHERSFPLVQRVLSGELRGNYTVEEPSAAGFFIGL